MERHRSPESPSLQSRHGPSRSAPPRRTGPVPTAAASYLVVLLSPAAAWLLWISWSSPEASDQAHLAWVGTVGLAAVLAGTWCPRRWWHVIGLTLLGTTSAVVTHYRWWSAQENDGLFLVGIALFTPLALAAGPLLVKLGMYVGSRRR